VDLDAGIAHRESNLQQQWLDGVVSQQNRPLRSESGRCC
jgi:hypothetical protein